MNFATTKARFLGALGCALLAGGTAAEAQQGVNASNPSVYGAGAYNRLQMGNPGYRMATPNTGVRLTPTPPYSGYLANGYQPGYTRPNPNMNNFGYGPGYGFGSSYGPAPVYGGFNNGYFNNNVGFNSAPYGYAVGGVAGSGAILLPSYGVTYGQNVTGFGMSGSRSYSQQTGAFGLPFTRSWGQQSYSSGFGAGGFRP